MSYNTDRMPDTAARKLSNRMSFDASDVVSDLQCDAVTSLFRSVVAQAFRDACSVVVVYGSSKNAKTDLRKRRLIQSQARSWLVDGSRDMREVCTMADMDPIAVGRRAREMAARGWPAIEEDDGRRTSGRRPSCFENRDHPAPSGPSAASTQRGLLARPTFSSR